MRFVIIASPRTGSTHLTGLLHKHDDIVCHGELFHPTKPDILRRWRSTDKVPQTVDELVELRKRNPKAFIERVFDNDHGRSHVGFKIFQGHNEGILDELIANSLVKKVILFRRNMLAVYSSSRIAHKTGERIRRTAKQGQPVVVFKPLKFVNYCRKYAGFYREVVEKLNRHRQDFRLVHYEEINDPSLFSGLLSFLGADPAGARLEGGSVKQNSSEILQRFSNPDEVEKFLRKHGLMDWMYEAEVSLDPFQAASAGGSAKDGGTEELTAPV